MGMTCEDYSNTTIDNVMSMSTYTHDPASFQSQIKKNEAALGVSFAYTGAFRARLRAANGGTVIEATPPGIDGIFENLSSGKERYDFVDDFASDIPVDKLAFEGDDQDARSCIINREVPR